MQSTATQDAAYAQRIDALERGNIIRKANARTLKDLEDLTFVEGLAVAADILRHADMSSPTGVIPAWRLITSISRVGEERAERIFADAGITRVRYSLRRLTDRQRHRLAYELDKLPIDSRTR